MPIYEYQCEACGHKLEVMQRMSDDPLITCPACSAERLRKLISAAGFQLKGTGWYETDFKNKGKAPAKKDGDGKDGGGKDGDAGKTGEGAKPADGKASEGKSGDTAAAAGEGRSGKSGTASAAD